MAKTYDPKSVKVLVAGFPITGYADGDFVTIEPSGEDYTMTTGADGEVTRVKQNNFAGTITLTLQASSGANDILNSLRVIDVRTGVGQVPISVVDLFGTSKANARQAWVRVRPTMTFGRDLGTREWIFDTGRLEATVGGSIGLG
jgi:hypothetical protein